MERIATGIPDLDRILMGGLPAYSTVLISGAPGTGKTILASQILYNNASEADRALFVSTISEPQSRIIKFTQGFSFFDVDMVGRAVLYEDIGPQIIQNGIDAAFAYLEKLVLDVRPAYLVIDSFRALSGASAAARHNIFRLAATLATLPCTSFLVGELVPHQVDGSVEASIADAILELDIRASGTHDLRCLRVRKLRGSSFIPGQHTFRISNAGIRVFPRLLTSPTPGRRQVSRERAPTGIAGLDEMFHGGPLRGTTTLVAGDPGVGKTVTCLHFILNGAERGEPGVYISFQEDPSQLARIAENFAFDLADLTSRGYLRMLYVSPVELDIDEHALEIMRHVEEINARRVVIDSVSDLEAGARHAANRFFDYLYSLIQWFKNRNISVMLTAEMSQIFASEISLTGRGVPHIADNLLLLRYTQMGGEIRRAITILAARGSDHSKQVREYIISESDGPKVGATLRGSLNLFAQTEYSE
jgi:circadian clock protein KaiC